MSIDHVNEPAATSAVPSIKEVGRRIFEAGWLHDNSVFTPSQPIWTSENADELYRDFVEQPDLSGATFMKKLGEQLSHTSDNARQLAAELLFLNLLPLGDYYGKTKKRVIDDVLAFCSRPVAIPDDLLPVLDRGAFSGGVAFKTRRWHQLSFLIQGLQRFKKLDANERRAVLSEPLRFREFITTAPGPGEPAQRNALKFLAFPDYFLPIVSGDHKKALREAFLEYVGEPTGDIDRDLYTIRTALEEELGGPVNFYESPLVERWRVPAKLAQGAPSSVESKKRRAWLIRGSSVQGKNLVPTWLEEGMCSLPASHLRPLDGEVTRDELRIIVEEDYSHVPYNARSDKVSEFFSFLTRMGEGDVVLTASNGKIYLGVVTGDAVYTPSPDGRSNLRRSVQWQDSSAPIDFADLPDPLPAKLAAQRDVVDLTEHLGLLEKLLGEPGPPPPKVAVLPDASAEFAEELLVNRPWLQECVELLRDQHQIIFYGPPGTGKTFIAQHLAWSLAGRGNTTLVQFHPSYSYEDFFEGFRPVPSAEGSSSVGFELTPGPFRRLVEQAREHPEEPHLLIIDEINRANLAKVFGELYFLLEYRDEAIQLLYSSGAEHPFTLPKNVYMIGTMNTADRSIALVDSAMRRRFGFVALHPDEEPTKSLLDRWLDREGMDHAPARLLDLLNSRIQDEEFRIGPSYLMRLSVYERGGGLERVWRTSIIPLLEEHHYGETINIETRYGLESLRRSLGGQPEVSGAEEEALFNVKDEDAVPPP